MDCEPLGNPIQLKKRKGQRTLWHILRPGKGGGAASEGSEVLGEERSLGALRERGLAWAPLPGLSNLEAVEPLGSGPGQMCLGEEAGPLEQGKRTNFGHTPIWTTLMCIYMEGKKPDSKEPNEPHRQSSKGAKLACLVYGCKQR